MKRLPIEWDKILANISGKELISKIYKDNSTIQCIKKPQKKGRGSGQTFFQRRHIDGQQTHEKMPPSTTHQGNANISLLSDWLFPKGQQITSIGEDMG